MANVVIFENGKAQLLKSVNTPDYPTAIVNPDLSALKGVPMKYWKESSGAVVEMTPVEKQVVLDAEIVEKQARIQALNINAITLAKALVKTGKITKQELITAIKEVQNG